MKDFNDLQNLWKEQETASLPDVNRILADAKKTQLDLNRKINLQVMLLLAVVLFILILVRIIPFQETTTFIGIGLMSVTIVAFSILRLYQVVRLKKMDLTQNPHQLLYDLETYYQFQHKIHSRYTHVYFLLMNIAFALYFIEVLKPVPTKYQFVIIAVYLAWMLFALLYLGKKHKLKEQSKIQSIIDAIKAIEYHYKA